MMGPQMMGPQMMGPMMGPQMMGSMMPCPQPSKSNSEKVFCKIERYGGSGSGSDDDYYEGGDGYRRRGRRRSRGKRRRSRRSSYSPTESSMPQNASLYSVPSAPAFLGPMTPMQQQQQQVYQMQPMMGTPQRAAPTAGLAASAPQPPYITDISNDHRDLDAIEKAMKKMYIERYPSENERQSLFPERSLIIILALIFIFVIVVVVIAVMGSSRPGFLHPATQPLPTMKTEAPPTTAAASTTAAAAKTTGKSF